MKDFCCFNLINFNEISSETAIFCLFVWVFFFSVVQLFCSKFSSLKKHDGGDSALFSLLIKNDFNTILGTYM